ncbi:MAG TPA: transcription-repair coupling factor [Promineifilum sp.]|nr:transcription-repair coupling factor [Promineifilum sp.]HRQ13456.1 transcription-repair coupling factor [Promineifilum sp.]
MNVSGLLDLLDQIPAFGQLSRALSSEGGAGDLLPLELVRGTRPPVVAQLYRRVATPRQAPIFLLTAKVDSANLWHQALETWLPEGSKLLRLPEPTPLPYDRGPWSDRTRQGRLAVLSSLIPGQHPLIPSVTPPPLVVSSIRAFLQKTLPKRRFIAATRVLRVGQVLDLEKSLTGWVDIGYEPVSVVEAAGQFSRRGGIIDIFPAAAEMPIRIELFGDEIETMRYFDPTTQRSLGPAEGRPAPEGVIITPSREVLPVAARDFVEVWADEPLPVENSLPSWRDDLDSLRAGQAFANLEYYLPLVYPRPVTLLDYLPQDALVVADDWNELKTAADELIAHAGQIAAEQSTMPPGYQSPLFTWDEIESELAWWQPLVLGEGRPTGPQEAEEPVYIELGEAFDPGPRYGGQTRPLLNQLKQARREGERVVVFSRQAPRLAELWGEDGGTLIRTLEPLTQAQPDQSDTILPVVTAIDAGTGRTGVAPLETLPDIPPDGSITFVQGSLAEGFILIRQEDHHVLLHLLTDAEIFGWSRPAPRRRHKARPAAPETFFADIKKGDHVVHLDHGIGLFEGLVVRSLGGMEREYLLVKYANGDTLYVPVHHADRLGKWIGPDDADPTLNRLGERTWTQAKAAAQRAADELAQELLDLYATRETIPGHAFPGDTDWQAELEAAFPYHETEDQLRVISEVKDDMERANPMDRLICGDVGYGKTEVALRAAFKAVMDGKQVAMLVPTTILAQQHYTTFRDRLAPFPVTVEMLSRFRTPAQQRNIVHKLREGNIDIIIGTHRLLSDDVSFKDLGLVIIDEEQRFGVADKERLKQWRTEVDVLTLTATPIPRTLHMALTGVRDISIIDTAPAERLPVETYVGEADDSRIRTAILRELDRGGQVFFVHNRVQSIHIVRKRLENLVPEARIVVAHGQMSERQLEKIMIDFAEGNVDILLSTTIIESGLDFPNANTLIVDRAEQFGLSQLYQLRGRVGRSTRRAYAYFFHVPWRTLTPDAQARLDAIAEHTQLGSGYYIAVRDMEIRGAGDFLGGEQSGHISAIGFDMYTRLLTKAVKRRKAEMRGEVMPVELPDNVLIDLPLATYIPTDYVPDTQLRLRLYRRMATLDTLAEIDEMATELADRFGPIPDPLHNLLYQIRVKALAQMAAVNAVVTEAGQIRIRLDELGGMDRFHLQRYLGDSVRVSKTAVWLKKDRGTHEWQIELVQILEKLRLFKRETPAITVPIPAEPQTETTNEPATAD